MGAARRGLKWKPWWRVGFFRWKGVEALAEDYPKKWHNYRGWHPKRGFEIWIKHLIFGVWLKRHDLGGRLQTRKYSNFPVLDFATLYNMLKFSAWLTLNANAPRTSRQPVGRKDSERRVRTRSPSGHGIWSRYVKNLIHVFQNPKLELELYPFLQAFHIDIRGSYWLIKNT